RRLPGRRAERGRPPIQHRTRTGAGAPRRLTWAVRPSDWPVAARSRRGSCRPPRNPGRARAPPRRDRSPPWRTGPIGRKRPMAVSTREPRMDVRLSDQQRRDFEEKGYVLLPDFFEPDELRRLLAA